MRRTIFSVATAAAALPARAAALAVVRVSGPSALHVAQEMAPHAPLAPRHATVRTLRHPRTGELLDRGIVLAFPAPHSFTGEDVVELHVHGGRAVVASVLDALAAHPDLRAAEAGEFTKRAFLNDKLDLTQVEALADLLQAETEWQRRQALRQMQGALSELYERWRGELVRSLANVEAVLDFGESEEVEDGVLEQVHAQVERTAHAIAEYLQRKHGELIRNGIRAVILGAPNAGKSSLLNVLAQRQAAIVSPIAGTTRDVIDVPLNLAGFPVVLSDTAGLRASTHDPIELEGMRRARERIAQSDLRLCVVDVTDAAVPVWALPAYIAEHVDRSTVLVLNKVDAVTPAALQRATDGVKRAMPGAPTFALSCTTGAGVAAFVQGVGRLLQERLALDDGTLQGDGQALAVTQQRHREHLGQCVEALGRAATASDVVLVAEELRSAVQSVGRITGRVDVEQILDVIFRDFCIGK